MEKKYMMPQNCQVLNVKEESNIIPEKKSGLKTFKDLLGEYRKSTGVAKTRLYKEICIKGLELLEDKKKAGWKYTPDGWLSPANIKAAGYVERDGVYLIPTEEYISEKKTETKEVGEKYSYYTKQYQDWKRRKYIKEYGTSYDEMIDKFLDKNN